MPLIAAQLPSAMYTPLVLLLAAYVVLTLLASRARSHEDAGRAERYDTIGFGLVLLAGLYAIVLLISAIVSYPSRTYDMVIVLIVVGVFFAILLFILFVLAEILPGSLRRSRDR